MTWRGSYMTDSDAFAYGECLGLARAIRLARQIIDEHDGEDIVNTSVGRIIDAFVSPDVREALAWLEEQEAKKATKKETR